MPDLVPAGTDILPVVVSRAGTFVPPVAGVTIVSCTLLVVACVPPTLSFCNTSITLLAPLAPLMTLVWVSSTASICNTLIVLVLVTVLPNGSLPTKVIVTTEVLHQSAGFTAAKL